MPQLCDKHIACNDGFEMKNSISGFCFKWVLSRENNAACGYYCVFCFRRINLNHPGSVNLYILVEDTWKKKGQIIVQITALNDFLNSVSSVSV